MSPGARPARARTFAVVASQPRRPFFGSLGSRPAVSRAPHTPRQGRVTTAWWRKRRWPYPKRRNSLAPQYATLASRARDADLRRGQNLGGVASAASRGSRHGNVSRPPDSGTEVAGRESDGGASARHDPRSSRSRPPGGESLPSAMRCRAVACAQLRTGGEGSATEERSRAARGRDSQALNRRGGVLGPGSSR